MRVDVKAEHKDSRARVSLFSLPGGVSRLFQQRKSKPGVLFSSDICFPVAFLVLEKVTAVNKYNPPPEVVAAQDHLIHVVHSMMQPQRVFDRYPFGVLGVELRAVSTGQAHPFPSPSSL